MGEGLHGTKVYCNIKLVNWNNHSLLGVFFGVGSENRFDLEILKKVKRG